MFATLTFATIFSAAPAVLKFAYDAVEFYSRVKALRSPKPPRPLAQLESLTRIERGELNKMYAAVERCRPVAADIAGRALRFYLVEGCIITAVLLTASIFTLWFRPLWSITVACAVALGGTALISLLPGPVLRVVSIMNKRALKSRIDEILRSLGSAWQDVGSTLLVSFRATGVSIPERAFLDAYSQAEVLIRVLECDVLVDELRSGISAAHETLTGRVFAVAERTIAELAKNGLLDQPAQRKTVLANAFRKIGLAELVSPELVGESFFEADFPALAKDDAALRKHLENYLSSKPRR